MSLSASKKSVIPATNGASGPTTTMPILCVITSYSIHYTKLYDFEADSDICHIPVIGPSKEGATLEGSKDYAKAFMMRHNIPTAGYLCVDRNNIEEGIAYLTTLEAPYVLKADGLAAGKGVLIIDNLEEAQSELRAMLGGKFGSASAKVVIEEFLSGIELSVFALTDGKDYVLLPEAKDYKRIGDSYNFV